MSEWISVKDRMPQIYDQKCPYNWSQECLCILRDNTFHILCLTSLGSWISFQGKYSTSLENVTHWMPLPKTPEHKE